MQKRLVRKHPEWPTPASLFIFFVLSLATPLGARERIVRTQLLMGNVPVSITIDSTPGFRTKALKAMEASFAEAKRIEETVSEWKTASQTSLLNQNAGRDWIPIGRDLMTILLRAQEISEETKGAFDVTFASSDKKATYHDLQLLPDLSLARLKRKKMKLGVSGIAKGYIVDCMSDVLKKNGLHHFIVNAGDLYFGGSWKTGIKNPDDPEGPPLCSFWARDQAVSTSGLYERGSHIINPKTKKPATHAKSVTVVTRHSVDADAWGTALFVLGEQRGIEVLKNHPELVAVIVGDSLFNHSTDCVPIDKP